MDRAHYFGIIFETPEVEEYLIFRTRKPHVKYTVGVDTEFVIFWPISVNSVVCKHTVISELNKNWFITVDFVLRSIFLCPFEIFNNCRFNRCGFRRYSD